VNHDEAPVVIGVGQAVNRPRQPEEAVDALELVTRAVYAAADDAGAAGGGPALLRRLDAVRVINMLSYSYPRPAATVAAAIGAPEPRVGVYTAPGGNSPQWQVNVAAERIARGEDGLTLVCGAEALESARVAAKHGITLSRGERGDVGEMAGDERSGVGPAEMALGLFAPASIYPVFENAVRARAGRGLDEHRRLLAELMARFSEVAATRPEAWFPERRTADQIYAATPSNRMVAYPYTKLMNAIIRVDQSAAVLLAPAGLARELGVPEEKWVYVWGGAEAADVWVPFERPRLDESPGIRLAAGSALAAAGVAIDDIDHFDLYSCFPVAVEMACDALGLALDDARGLTVTGGLAAFGGPGNNYVTHAIAAMVERLRERPGDKGLCTGLGWYVTKHSAGVGAAGRAAPRR
jgi:acetyl-CoA C-acetyltransferase